MSRYMRLDPGWLVSNARFICTKREALRKASARPEGRELYRALSTTHCVHTTRDYNYNVAHRKRLEYGIGTSSVVLAEGCTSHAKLVCTHCLYIYISKLSGGDDRPYNNLGHIYNRLIGMSPLLVLLLLPCASYRDTADTANTANDDDVAKRQRMCIKCCNMRRFECAVSMILTTCRFLRAMFHSVCVGSEFSLLCMHSKHR